MEWTTLYDALYPLFADADQDDLYEWKDDESPEEAAASDFAAMMLEPINSHFISIHSESGLLIQKSCSTDAYNDDAVLQDFRMYIPMTCVILIAVGAIR